MRSFTRTQLRKTTHRNKKKTRRNKRTKNARGGTIMTQVEGDTTSTFNTQTNEMKITFNKKGKELLIFEGTLDLDAPANRKGVLNKYGKDDTLYSTYTGELNGSKRHGHGKFDRYDAHEKLVESHDGMWNNDKKDGEGVSTWYNEKGDVQKILKGVWSDDGMWINKMDGKGLFTVYDENGRVKKTIEGVWLNNNLHGQGVSTWYDEDGKVIKSIVVILKPSAIQPPPSQPSQSSKPSQPSQPSKPVPLLRPPPPRNSKALTDRMNGLFLREYDD